MCGIVGLFTNSPIKAHVKLFQTLMLHSGIRGLHSTGIYSPSTQVIKDACPVDQFVVQHQNQIQPDKVLLGHVRYSTSGNNLSRLNAQPLEVGNLILVHNGIVDMSADFASKFGVSCSTFNDSEVILSKVSDYTDQGSDIGESIRRAFEDITKISNPVYACCLHDRSTNKSYFWKDQIRPLHLFYLIKKNCYVLTSTKDIFVRSLPKQDCDFEEVFLKPYTVYSLDSRLVGLTEVVELPRPTTSTKLNYQSKHKINLTQLVSENLKPLDFLPSLVDYRIYRRRGFIDYYASMLYSWDVDPAYPLLRYLFERYELSVEQQYWACWLYGVFYHVASVHWVLQEFPDFELVDFQRLSEWHESNWRLLQYETDRRHEKGLFLDRFQSYKEWVGEGTQEDKFASCLVKDDLYKSYDNVMKQASKLRGFGRYALFYYTEALARCIGLPIECSNLPLKDSESSRNGLCYALKRDDLVDCKNLSKEDYAFLELEQSLLIQDIKDSFPDLSVDYWFLETVECAYKGLFKRRRYIGYYLDRLAEEIVSIQNKGNSATSGVDWFVLEEFRQECLNQSYLNQEIQTNQLSAMLDQGELANLHPKTHNSSSNITDTSIRGGLLVKNTSRKHKLISQDRKSDLTFLSALNHQALNHEVSALVFRTINDRGTK